MTDSNISLPVTAKVHFLGIGGSGMSAIARLMTDLGYEVSGCDAQDSPQVESLLMRGIPVEIGQAVNHITLYKPDAIITSSAVPDDNPELVQARQQGIPVYKRAEIVGMLMEKRTGVAIAGTHGKTTTTAMAAYTLTSCGQDPSFIVGGMMADYNTNARAGKGKPFVVEADEYDRMFLGVRPRIIVLTSMEMDHPDMFESMNDIRLLYREFVDRLPEDGLLIAGHDSRETVRVAKSRLLQAFPALTYGISGGTWSATDVHPNNKGGMSFSARHLGFPVGKIALRVPGEHNVQNALAVMALSSELGVSSKLAAEALSNFGGVRRRFEIKGQVSGVTVIDDYAHHPTAIERTLEAARQRFGEERRIWAVWQPHTYQRTKILLDEFAASFDRAAHVIITDVYRSRDTDTYGITPDHVIARMPDHPDVRHIAALDDVVTYLAGQVKAGDVVIVMSAGDATRITNDLVQALTDDKARVHPVTLPDQPAGDKPAPPPEQKADEG